MRFFEQVLQCNCNDDRSRIKKYTFNMKIESIKEAYRKHVLVKGRTKKRKGHGQLSQEVIGFRIIGNFCICIILHIIYHINQFRRDKNTPWIDFSCNEVRKSYALSEQEFLQSIKKQKSAFFCLHFLATSLLTYREKKTWWDSFYLQYLITK